MTTPQEQTTGLSEIILSTEAEKKLKDLMFSERHGLSTFFAETFGIQYDEVSDDKICFLGGKEADVKKAFGMLVGAAATGTHISKEVIRRVNRNIATPEESLTAGFGAAANQNTKQQGFRPRTAKQQAQAELITANDITFSIGPAGTGKTHVAMAMAIQALRENKIKKILLARPALETGEKLGFQPGDQNAKMAPYMRPLYDELDKAYGPGKAQAMVANGTIEIVPIGFMRGRTFESAFIIVDEAQNCKFEHLKMAITRLGPGSKMVITGDPEQVDFEPVSLSGLKRMVEQLEGVEGVGVQRYNNEDVVRHPTVQRIVERLESTREEKAPAPPRP